MRINPITNTSIFRSALAHERRRAALLGEKIGRLRKRLRDAEDRARRAPTNKELETMRARMESAEELAATAIKERNNAVNIAADRVRAEYRTELAQLDNIRTRLAIAESKVT